MDTPRRPTPAPTAHPNRHTPTKIAYRPSALPSSTDRLNHSRQKADSSQATPQGAARTRGVSPSRLPAVGSLKFSPLPAPPIGPGVSMQASPEPAAGSEVASEVSAPINAEAAPVAASTLQLGTVEMLTKSMPDAVQQDQLTARELSTHTVSASLRTGSQPAAKVVPMGPQVSQVPVRDAHAAESPLGSDSKAASAVTPSASAHHAHNTASPYARGEHAASAAVDQKVQQSDGLSRALADEAAQQHTAGLCHQHAPPRNVTAAGSTAVATPTQAAIPGASAGSSPADLHGPALMPRSGLGATPSTGNASLSASISPAAMHSNAVTAGAQSDMYAVSDALLLDNISAAAASQGSAGSKQSGCASLQTGAASSSSTTPASKGTQVGPLLANNPARPFVLGLPGFEMWLKSKHSGKKHVYLSIAACM